MDKHNFLNITKQSLNFDKECKSVEEFAIWLLENCEIDKKTFLKIMKQSLNFDIEGKTNWEFAIWLLENYEVSSPKISETNVSDSNFNRNDYIKKSEIDSSLNYNVINPKVLNINDVINPSFSDENKSKIKENLSRLETFIKNKKQNQEKYKISFEEIEDDNSSSKQPFQNTVFSDDDSKKEFDKKLKDAEALINKVDNEMKKPQKGCGHCGKKCKTNQNQDLEKDLLGSDL